MQEGGGQEGGGQEGGGQEGGGQEGGGQEGGGQEGGGQEDGGQEGGDNGDEDEEAAEAHNGGAVSEEEANNAVMGADVDRQVVSVTGMGKMYDMMKEIFGAKQELAVKLAKVTAECDMQKKMMQAMLNMNSNV
ncbi:hypothetical protein HYH03_010608 [Edaphochlamys debaryana]|uniref:Uncharacterized protein n=1 Tax=Edaphochlamys debaryana TaxID=47281 RepID=A0A836BVR3_9CHLO|nr:hypothetical protein HYH03_010608 [Edaphochlamys debaryana]|eukprot:KAG2490931.1 hypothetical protein HYH03_010608 [Edaphochlamys debaryana]